LGLGINHLSRDKVKNFAWSGGGLFEGTRKAGGEARWDLEF
jgi:hypothetical protein